MAKVMTFGTFDILHPGHEFYLRESKKYTKDSNYSKEEELITIVARDENVLRYKKKAPQHTQNIRLKKLKELGISDIVELGEEKETFKPIEKHKPDIICLGYDQHSHNVDIHFPNIKIIRIGPFKEHIYKSSLIKKNGQKNEQNIYRFKNGCLVCNGDIKGNKERKYFCKKCNLLFSEEQLLNEGLKKEPLKDKDKSDKETTENKDKSNKETKTNK